MLTRPRLRSGNASMIKTTGSFLGTVIMRFHRSHVFWALFLSRFSGFPNLLRDAQPGTAKGALGYREAFGLADSLIFIPWPEGPSAHIAIPFLRRLWTTQQSDKQPR